MIIHNLRITTKVRLHPEFVTDRRSFSRRNKVHLVDKVLTNTSFKAKPRDPDDLDNRDARYDWAEAENSQVHDDSDPDERIQVVTAGIPLFRPGAIRLSTVREEGGDWIQSIDLNPSILIYDEERHPLAKGDLPLALSILKKQVLPLLADPLDALHIVPGLLRGVKHIAFWSEVDMEFLFPGLQTQCLHNLSHPLTGRAEGAKRDRIQLGDKKDECVILIEKAQGKMDAQHVETTLGAIRVRLTLKGSQLTHEFRAFGRTAEVNETKRLVAFSEHDIASVHQAVLARLEGTHLPVPEEWKDEDEGKRLTAAKAMALVSLLTSMRRDEIQAIDVEVRNPSKSTVRLLEQDLEIEGKRLRPVAVATLFLPAAYAKRLLRTGHAADAIDPEIAAAYGEP